MILGYFKQISGSNRIIDGSYGALTLARTQPLKVGSKSNPYAEFGSFFFIFFYQYIKF